MGIITALAVAGVAAGAAAGSALAKKKAADKAASAQTDAVSAQQKILKNELSYSKVNQESLNAERNRIQNRIALQEQFDPELAQLRTIGKQKLLEEAQRPDASRQTTQVANQLFKENIQANPEMEKLKDQLISRAQADLAAGATLPPEFQAELVRSGITGGTQAGLRPVQSTIGGNVTQALGGAGIRLQQEREQQATGLATAAQNITDSRARLLSNVFPSVAAVEQSQRQRAAGAFGVGQETLPEGGLTGQEAANLQINRGNTLMRLREKKGNISAQKALAAGQARSQYIQAGGQFASSAIGSLSSFYGAQAAGNKFEEQNRTI